MKAVPPKNRFKGFSVIIAVVWILFAVICIQGYLLYFKKGAWPTQPPRAVSGKIPPKKPISRPAQPSEVRGYMAVVIDDWGYNRSHCRYLEAISVPLGVAIIPELPYSKDIIACAKANGKEPMLHLPMEPHRFVDKSPPKYLLTTTMSGHTIRKLLAVIFKDMQGIAGVNNHMGSKATEDPAVMSAVLAEIKKRGFFFVDSFTSEQSVASDVAGKLKMKIARRDVFLDNRNERTAIEKQFLLAARIARRKGFALIIGHDRELTLRIIKEQTDKLRREGIEFLPIKEYIRRYEYSGN